MENNFLIAKKRSFVGDLDPRNILKSDQKDHFEEVVI